jgi:hypothetical protein
VLLQLGLFFNAPTFTHDMLALLPQQAVIIFNKQHEWCHAGAIPLNS